MESAIHSIQKFKKFEWQRNWSLLRSLDGIGNRSLPPKVFRNSCGREKLDSALQSIQKSKKCESQKMESAIQSIQKSKKLSNRRQIGVCHSENSEVQKEFESQKIGVCHTKIQSIQTRLDGRKIGVGHSNNSKNSKRFNRAFNVSALLSLLVMALSVFRIAMVS